MGVVNVVEEVLSATFQLPIVLDITQTKVERAIGYQISRSRIRTMADSRQTHEVSLEITLRAENGYDSLGWLSAKLAAGMSSGENWRIMAVGAEESVDYVTKGEILISVSATVQMTIWHDQVKEEIRSVTMEADNG